MSIQNKLLAYILSVCFFIFGTTVVYITYHHQQIALKDAQLLTDSYAREYANSIASYFNLNMGTARTMSHFFSAIETHPSTLNSYLENYLRNLLQNRKELSATWVNLELSLLHQNPSLHGRLRYTVYREANSLFFKIDTLDLESEREKSFYYKLKKYKTEELSSPYFETYSQNSENQSLIVSIGSPIVQDGKFVGAAGIDLSVQEQQQIMLQNQPDKVDYAFLMSNEAMIVVHPQKEFIGKILTKVDTLFLKKAIIEERISKGENFSVQQQTPKGSFYVSFSPIRIGKSERPWSLAVVMPTNIMEKKIYQSIFVSLVVTVVGLIILVLVIIYISSKLTRPLQKIIRILNDLSQGEIDDTKKMSVKSTDEIGSIRKSVNELIDGLQSTAGFANEIGKGNYNADFKLLGNKDMLGKSLLDMRESLKRAKALDEKAHNENEIRNWTTHGVALFSELLRQNNDEINEVSYKVISNLVNYLGANQGAIFIINDNDKKHLFLDLVAAYAYNRRKILEKQIELGENVVGRCVLERESIFITELPPNYSEITSGLGGESPRCLLLTPLIFNQQVYGVVEIASFKLIEPYHIEFVERIGQIIASSVSIIKNKQNTTKILEESQKKSKEYEHQQAETLRINENLLVSLKELELEKNELLEALHNIKNERTLQQEREEALVQEIASLKNKKN